MIILAFNMNSLILKKIIINIKNYYFKGESLISNSQEFNLEKYILGYCHKASIGTDEGIFYQNLNLNDIYNDPAYLNKNSIEFDSVKERLKQNGYIQTVLFMKNYCL